MTGLGEVAPPWLTRRVGWLIASALLTLHAGLAWAARAPGILTGQDDARYLILARALRAGGFADLHLVGTPPHYMYPPGFPAILATWTAVVGEGYDALIAVNIAASAGMLALVFIILWRLWGGEVALLILAALAVNPYLIGMPGQLRPETVFGLLVMVALWAASHQSSGWGLMLAAGLAALFAALTRMVGVALIVAVVCHWLLSRRWRAAAVLTVIGALAFGGWLWRSASSSIQLPGASYVADLTHAVERPGPSGTAGHSLAATVIGRAKSNVPEYLGRRIPYQLPVPTVPGTPVDNAAAAALTAVGLAIGLAVLLVRWRVAGLFLLMYTSILVIWPWTSWRFIVPVLPLLVTAAVLGLATAAGWKAKRLRHWAAFGVVGVLFLTGLVQSGARLAEARTCDRERERPAGCITAEQEEFFRAAGYIATSTPPDAVFYSMKPEPLYLYAGRRTVAREMPIMVSEPDRVVAALRDLGVDYVLAGGLQWSERRQLPEALVTNCADLDFVRAFGARTYLFRIRPQTAVSDSTEACRAARRYRDANVDLAFE